MSPLSIFIIVLLLSCATPAIAALCNEGSLANGTAVLLPDTFNTISYCALGSISFETSTAAGLTVSDSIVAPGSTMRVVFGNSALVFRLQTTEFQQDARLIIEGPLYTGITLTIIGCSFDVRTPLNGVIIAIDLRRLTALSNSRVTVSNCSIFIGDNSDDEQPSLVAGVAAAPALSTLSSSFTVNDCSFALNTSAFVIAYAVHIVATVSLRTGISILTNTVRHIRSASLSTAFFIEFPFSSPTNETTIQALSVKFNTVDRISGFLSLKGFPSSISVIANQHTHNGPTTCNFSFAGTPSFNLEQNDFSTFYEAWDMESTFANPVISIEFTELMADKWFLLAHNNFYASNYSTTPIIFPGPSNLLRNSSLYLLGNYFSTTQFTDISPPMSSFAVGPFSPHRTVDLGTVYVCSNVWPPVHVQATTTTAHTQTVGPPAPSTSLPPTRPAVAPISEIDIVISLDERPSSVATDGALCPNFVATTRRPTSQHPQRFECPVAQWTLLLSLMLMALSV
eukprot:GILI01012275.1.p1 GENE.GILI01012275.1~~GILI01012275.1.p1  ORF type:complete len:510 (+),score=33.60 GILI01012275.1:108-1637(+)